MYVLSTQNMHKLINKPPKYLIKVKVTLISDESVVLFVKVVKGFLKKKNALLNNK